MQPRISANERESDKNSYRPLLYQDFLIFFRFAFIRVKPRLIFAYAGSDAEH